MITARKQRTFVIKDRFDGNRLKRLMEKLSEKTRWRENFYLEFDAVHEMIDVTFNGDERGADWLIRKYPHIWIRLENPHELKIVSEGNTKITLRGKNRFPGTGLEVESEVETGDIEKTKLLTAAVEKCLDAE